MVSYREGTQRFRWNDSVWWLPAEISLMISYWDGLLRFHRECQTLVFINTCSLLLVSYKHLFVVYIWIVGYWWFGRCGTLLLCLWDSDIRMSKNQCCVNGWNLNGFPVLSYSYVPSRFGHIYVDHFRWYECSVRQPGGFQPVGAKPGRNDWALREFYDMWSLMNAFHLRKLLTLNEGWETDTYSHDNRESR